MLLVNVALFETKFSLVSILLYYAFITLQKRRVLHIEWQLCFLNNSVLIKNKTTKAIVYNLISKLNQ